RKGEPLGERGIQQTVKYGGGNIMVWGCMGMNGQQYVDILDNNLLESIEILAIDPQIAIFQQDNNFKHISK
ncbi:hypothetical protein GYMLUDRAFT_119473, partial [Collybiopsis luxurians FD-317 M1]